MTPSEWTMADDQISNYKKGLRSKGRKSKTVTKGSAAKTFRIKSTSDLIPFGKHQGKRFNAVALSFPNYLKGFINHKQLSVAPEVFSRLALLILTSPTFDGKK